VSATLPSAYRVCLGSPLDRALLLKFAHRAYREIEPERSSGSLPAMIDRYLSRSTPIWWLEICDHAASASLDSAAIASPIPRRSAPQNPIACLWLGSAVSTDDEPRAHVLLIYVAPEHRRQGLATYLLEQAETWAKQHGDRGIGLQVMTHNQAAIALYDKLGYVTLSQWMNKPLTKPLTKPE